MTTRMSATVSRARPTKDARAALERAGFSRRDFLKGSGALIVSFSAARFDALAPGLAVAQGSPVPGDQLDSWIAIRADGLV
ncbi:MAG: twin-arginine translocation signal domain-containing protein, partial [Vicinamibacterales bacterium]